MNKTTDYTDEELQFYLHKTNITKQRQIANSLKDTDENISKREKRKIRAANKQVKIAMKEVAKEKFAYWANTSPRYRSYLNGANKRGLSFSLTMDQFILLTENTRCIFCNTDKCIGVDRINSIEGYYIDNCQPCCNNCNLMKRNMSDNDFLLHIAAIHNNRNKL